MASDLAQFTGHLFKAAEAIPAANREAVKAASLAAKEIFDAGARSVRTPKTINTAKGRKGNAYGVKFLWFTTERIPRTVTYFWGAPPYWRERGTEAHEVRPRKGKQALLINGLFADRAEVAGVTARPFWRPTKEAAHRAAMPIVHKANLAALVKVGYR